MFNLKLDTANELRILNLMPRPSFHDIADRARACRICEEHLPLGPRPVFRASPTARILIVGQAPGTRVHETGIPWNDPSGDRLRQWLDMDRDTFYDESRIAIVPMGFCYPGRLERGGDRPPRPECAPTWHPPLLEHMPKLETIILCGQYAHAYYLADRRHKSLAATAKAWRDFAPEYWPLVHPSPRNTLWLKKNPWFEEELIPAMRDYVQKLL